MNERIYERIGERLYTQTLPNGLRVQVVPKPGFCKKYAFFATRYGGMDLRFRLNGQWLDTPAGIAHYLEHKMFDTKEGNALQVLSQNGAEPNAFTANSITAYYFDCTEHFEENLRILLSFVSIPYFTDESVNKERGIIGQEIRMVEDTPDWVAYETLMANLYRNSPARIAITGTVESIADITAQTLYDCHRAFYAPSNMTLCVVGDVDPERIAAIAQEILPADPGSLIERDYGAEEPMTPACALSRRKMDVSQTQFLAGFKCETAQKGDALLRESLIGELACDILLGEASPLYSELYEKGWINASFDASFEQLPGIAFLYAGGESPCPEKVCDAIVQRAQSLARDGIDEVYYQQIRKANFGASIRAFNSFENIAVDLTDGYFLSYDAFRLPEMYDTIEKADVAEFLRRCVTAERRAISIIDPRKER